MHAIRVQFAALLVSGVSLLSAVVSAETRYYADCGSGNNVYDGTTNVVTLGTWHGPKKSISSAINVAGGSNSIVVAAGFYQETAWEAGTNSLTIVPEGTVTIYDSDPWQTDSDGDGMTDAWEVKYGLDAFSTNGVNGATGDADSDNVSNIEEYLAGTNPQNSDNTPPTITATITPTPNAAGWNTNNVTVHFSPSDSQSGIAWASSDVYTVGETNDAEVLGFALDNAGNVAITTVHVRIDKTAPMVTGHPSDGETEHNATAPIVVQYDDDGSGVAPDQLSASLDGAGISGSFQSFAKGAIYLPQAEYSLGQHSLTVTVVDVAGNAVTVGAVFTVEAPSGGAAITDFDLKDGVTVAPDISEIWVQGRRHDTNITVSASVNFGPTVRMNTRDLDFGYLLPLQPGTNVIVLTSSNPTTRAFLVERSQWYQVEMFSPDFGEFANGQPKNVWGQISVNPEAGMPADLGLATVAVNGVAAEMYGDGSGGAEFESTDPVGGTNCTIMPIIISICWTNGSFSTELCPEIPLGLLEGYEIESKRENYWHKSMDGYHPQSYFYWSPVNGACTSGPPWQPVYVYRGHQEYEFDMPCTATESNVFDKDFYVLHADPCVEEPSYTNINWMAEPPDPPRFHVLQPDRGLRFGKVDGYGSTLYDWAQDGVPVDGVVDGEVRTPEYVSDEGSMTVRVPFYYPTDTPVMLTFEGVDYARIAGEEFDGNLVTYNGQSPVAVYGHDLSYLEILTGGDEFVISKDSFDWPESHYATNTGWISDGELFEHKEIVDLTAKHLQIGGLHNKVLYVNDVTFSGAIHPIVPDSPNSPYNLGSHWHDADFDKNAKETNPREWRIPVCYTAGAKMQVGGTFGVGVYGTPVEIVGLGSDGSTFAISVVPSTGPVTVQDIPASQPLPNTIKRIWPYTIDWKLVINGRTIPLGRTDHRVYEILSGAPQLPIYGDMLPETALDISCRNADGIAFGGDIVGAIWKDFYDPLPGVLRKPVDGYNFSDNQPMTYWGLACVANRSNYAYTTVDYLMRSGEGKCGAWAQLMWCTLACQGVTGSLIISPISAITPTNAPPRPEDVGLPGWTYANYAQLLVKPSNEAQNNKTPWNLFDDHAVVILGRRIYDPSYGKDYGSENEWENASLEGVVYWYRSPDGLQTVSRVVPNDPAKRQTIFNPHAIP